jgi:hypothetical protein
MPPSVDALQRPQSEEPFQHFLRLVLQDEHGHVRDDQNFDGGRFHVRPHILQMMKADSS